MAFRGWPAEALEFYEGLSADNSRSYWMAHQPVFEQAVKAPMLALLAELEPEFGPGRAFRPYRDVRFSADKSPYKDRYGATLDNGGYIQLSADGLAAGRGFWMMAPDQLDRYRRAVDDPTSGRVLERMVTADPNLDVVARDSLKTSPRGYPRDHPRAELLRYKGLAAWREWPVEPWLGTAAAKKRIIDFLRAAQPLADWLTAHVGASTAPPDRTR